MVRQVTDEVAIVSVITSAAKRLIRPETAGLLDGIFFGKGKVRLPLVDPDSGESIGTLLENDDSEVAQAVIAARKAFDDRRWAGLKVTDRAQVLRKTAALIDADADLMAAVDSLTTGLLWHKSTRRQARSAAEWFRFFADIAEQEIDPTFLTSAEIQTVVSREAVGVVALYTPWNIPLMAAGLKLAAALVMGNSVVIKPSEQSPLGTHRLVELLYQAGLPRDVVQLVNGRGQVTGAALAANPGIDAISFTGGPVAGAAVAAAASLRFARTTLELGGKSASVVLADAPYDSALDGVISAAFGNSGQACLAGSRVLVEAKIADRFIADLITRTKALKIGHSFDEEADIGAQSSLGQMQRVLSFVDLARAEGAELLCGGRRAEGFSGYQLEPALALVQSNSLRVCQEEVFGPLATVQIVADHDEAVRVANDSRFGLANYIWCGSDELAQNIAKELRSGTVLINTPMVRERHAPFGGFGASGLDREGGRWSLDFYSEAKTTLIARANANRA